MGFKKRWTKEHKASKIQVVKEQGVCFGVQWEIGDGRRGFFLVFHLDAAEESTRIAQLEEMGEWVRNNVRGGDLLLFGGDRNFTMREDERMSSRRSTWRPSAKMNEAWSRWEMNTAASTLEQPEFTWQKLPKKKLDLLQLEGGEERRRKDAEEGSEAASDDSGDEEAGNETDMDGSEADEADCGESPNKYSYAILDVVGINEATAAVVEPNFFPAARRVELKYRASDGVSDHYPIALEWVPRAKRKRQAKPASEPLVRRALPEWLFENTTFLGELDESVRSWSKQRQKGNAGLVEFTDLVYTQGSAYLKQSLVRAVSTGHRLEVAISLLRMMAPLDEEQRSAVEPVRALRLLQIYPQLQDVIELEVDERDPGKLYVDAEGREALRKIIRELLEKAAQENAEDAPGEADVERSNEEIPGSTWGHHADAPLLRRIKELKKGKKRIEVRELWDPAKEEYVVDVEEQGVVIQNAMSARQGQPRGAPLHSTEGEEILRKWAADFSACKLTWTASEVEEIIRQIPPRRAPGPDGVPGVALRRYARVLVPVFIESWDELLGAEDRPEWTHLRYKKWLIQPKKEGVRNTDGLRDLELANETRKTLERMLYQTLAEPASKTLSSAQQGFIPGREITRNTIMLADAFWRAAAKAAKDPTSAKRLFLLLDCRKGFNSMGWEWLERCLRAAKTPEPLIRLVKELLRNEPILCVNGEAGWREFDPIQMMAGLTQGGPASTILYVIGVDPFLEEMQRIADGVVSGFADDWAIEVEGVAQLQEVIRAAIQFEGGRKKPNRQL